MGQNGRPLAAGIAVLAVSLVAAAAAALMTEKPGSVASAVPNALDGLRKLFHIGGPSPDGTGQVAGVSASAGSAPAGGATLPPELRRLVALAGPLGVSTAQLGAGFAALRGEGYSPAGASDMLAAIFGTFARPGPAASRARRRSPHGSPASPAPSCASRFPPSPSLQAAR